MRILFASVAMLLAASAARAQDKSNVPMGNPLGATPAPAGTEQAQREAQRARLQAAARARANAQAMAEAFGQTVPVASLDEGRQRAAAATFGQPAAPTDTATRAAPSPYGGYYQIRTPWDRR